MSTIRSHSRNNDSVSEGPQSPLTDSGSPLKEGEEPAVEDDVLEVLEASRESGYRRRKDPEYLRPGRILRQPFHGTHLGMTLKTPFGRR